MEEQNAQTSDSNASQAGGVDTKGIWSLNNAFLPKGAFTKEQQDKDLSGEIKAAAWHMFLTALIPLFLLPMARFTNLTISAIIGIAYLAVFACFLIHIFWFMLTAKNIYSISSMGAVPHRWVGMRIAYSNKEHKHKPIGSISAFCAIDGGVAKILLARLGSYGWTIIMMFMMFEAHQKKVFHVDLIFEGVGAFGLVMIGTFFDDPQSPTKGCRVSMGLGHGIGILLGMFTEIGFLIQRIRYDLQHLWLPIIFILTTVVFGIWFRHRSNPKTHWRSDKPEKVRKHSLITLVLETLALAPMTFSIAAFFIMYED